MRGGGEGDRAKGGGGVGGGIREDGSYFAIKTRGRKQDGEPEREREREEKIVKW